MNSRKETVLITGSSGHIASALIRRLGSRYEIAGFDFAGEPAAPTRATIWDSGRSARPRL